MRSFVILAAAGAALLVSGAATAGDKAESPKAKKVCRVVEPAFGRLPAKRVCEIKAEAPSQLESANREAPVEAAPAGEESGRGN